ncbi:unnamed protein product [Meloidogyne enterolobii]|uniref:Uncharacterized protein n=1 Tax=Meloidogyne enterolobii TaxID=390850 RepID=A0ACB0Y958_MELEN
MSIPKTLNILVFVIIVLECVNCMDEIEEVPEEVPLPDKPSSKKSPKVGGSSKASQHHSGLRVEVPEEVQVPLLQNKPSKKFLRKTQSSVAEGKEQMSSPKSDPHLLRTQSEPKPHDYMSLNSPHSPLNKSPLKRHASESSTKIGYLAAQCGNCLNDVVNCYETCVGKGKPEGYTSEGEVEKKLEEKKNVYYIP